jgi:hypothetical protein
MELEVGQFVCFIYSTSCLFLFYFLYTHNNNETFFFFSSFFFHSFSTFFCFSLSIHAAKLPHPKKAFCESGSMLWTCGPLMWTQGSLTTRGQPRGPVLWTCVRNLVCSFIGPGPLSSTNGLESWTLML